MSKLLFMGVENEFQLIREGRPVNLVAEWNDLFDNYPHPCFRKTPTCIRTHTGGSVYADQSEPETCTAPIRIERGFATKLGQALYLARKDLVDLVKNDPTLSLAGYSMHWNTTSPERKHIEHDSIGLTNMYALPWQLFTLTPLSVGSNMRIKDEGNRLEQLGDHIPGEEQATAFALLYAASVLHPVPTSLYWNSDRGIRGRDHSRSRNGVTNGRTSAITPVENGIGITITAQEYLERVHRQLHDTIHALGTPDEIKLLNDFVRGRKELEVDRAGKYQRLAAIKTNTIYTAFPPELLLNMDAYTEAREPPTPLARFFGALAHQDMPRPLPVGMKRSPVRIDKLDWHMVQYGDAKTPGSSHVLKGMDWLALAAEVVDARGDPSQIKTIMSMAGSPRKDGRPLLYAALVLAEAGGPCSDLKYVNLIDENGKPNENGRAFMQGYARLYPEHTMDAAQARAFLLPAPTPNARNVRENPPAGRHDPAARGQHAIGSPEPGERTVLEICEWGRNIVSNRPYFDMLYNTDRPPHQNTRELANSNIRQIRQFTREYAIAVLDETDQRLRNLDMTGRIGLPWNRWTLTDRQLQDEILRRGGLLDYEQTLAPSNNANAPQGTETATRAGTPDLEQILSDIMVHNTHRLSVANRQLTEESIRRSDALMREITNLSADEAYRALTMIDRDIQTFGTGGLYGPRQAYRPTMTAQELRDEILRRANLDQYVPTPDARTTSSPVTTREVRDSICTNVRAYFDELIDLGISAGEERQLELDALRPETQSMMRGTFARIRQLNRDQLIGTIQSIDDHVRDAAANGASVIYGPRNSWNSSMSTTELEWELLNRAGLGTYANTLRQEEQRNREENNNRTRGHNEPQASDTRDLPLTDLVLHYRQIIPQYIVNGDQPPHLPNADRLIERIRLLDHFAANYIYSDICAVGGIPREELRPCAFSARDLQDAILDIAHLREYEQRSAQCARSGQAPAGDHPTATRRDTADENAPSRNSLTLAERLLQEREDTFECGAYFAAQADTLHTSQGTARLDGIERILNNIEPAYARARARIDEIRALDYAGAHATLSDLYRELGVETWTAGMDATDLQNTIISVAGLAPFEVMRRLDWSGAFNASITRETENPRPQLIQQLPLEERIRRIPSETREQVGRLLAECITTLDYATTRALLQERDRDELQLLGLTPVALEYHDMNCVELQNLLIARAGLEEYNPRPGRIGRWRDNRRAWISDERRITELNNPEDVEYDRTLISTMMERSPIRTREIDERISAILDQYIGDDINGPARGIILHTLFPTDPELFRMNDGTQGDDTPTALIAQDEERS